MIKFLNKKYLCDYEYYKDAIFAGGMITADENKFVKLLQGIIYGEEDNEVKRLAMFTWNVENNKFDAIKTENQELVSEVISDILVELKKESL